MTNWLDRFAIAASAIGASWGAAVDLVSSPFDDDDESFAEIAGKFGQLTIGAANAVGQTAVGIGGGALWAANKAAENLVSEPLSTAITAGSLADSDTFLKQQGLTRWNALLSGSTWEKARGMADTRSFGQSVYAAFATDDVIAEEQRIEAAKDSFLFNAVSGTLDAGVSLFLDPTIVLGKVGAASKAVRKGFGAGHRASDPWLQRQIAKRTNIGVGDVSPDDYANSDNVTKLLEWAQQRPGRRIADHPAVKASPYRSVIAGLLQDADLETGRLIVATAYGSKKALGQLAERRDDLAMRVARADNQVNFALQYEISRGWRDKMPAMMPAIRQKPAPKLPEDEQLPLFDIGAFPAGAEGVGSKAGPKGPTSMPDPVRGQPAAGMAGSSPWIDSYKGVSGNLPQTVRGKYFVAPKSGADAAPYWMQGPVNADSVKDLVRYFRGDAATRSNEKWEQLTVPGLPAKDSSWKAATSWKQHDETLAQQVDEWDGEELSMRIMPWDRQSTKWFMSMQRELAQKAGKERDLLTAAAGNGGEDAGRGVWNSMIGQVIAGDKQLRKADRTVAYAWESRSLTDSTVIHPKGFGLPVRVVKGAPFSVMKSFDEKRAPSWIDPNRGDSHAAFAAYLNGIKVFDPAGKDALMRKYLSAFDPGEKRELLARTEATALKLLAQSYGLSEDAAKEIARRSIGERNSVITQLRKQKGNDYAAPVAVTPEHFPWEDFPVDDDLIPVTAPILETQEVNSIPLLDLERYDRAFRAQAKNLRAFDRGAANAAEFMDRAYDVLNPLWSFSVLMRFGYTVRTLTDDMLRIWASLGAMSIMGNLAAGAKNFTVGGAGVQRAKNLKTRAKILGVHAYGATAGRGSEDVARVVRELTDEMGRDIESVTTVGELGFVHRGRGFRGPYEGRGDVYRQVVGGSYEAIARTTREMIEKLRSEYAGWDVKSPTDPDHLDSWAYVLNNQIGKSAIAQRFLRGETGEQVERWLRRTPEGQQVRKRIGVNGRDPQRLAGTVQAMVDQYAPFLAGDPAGGPTWLRSMAARGEVTAKQLEEFFPDVATRPQVHGPTVDLALQRGPIHQFMDSVVSNGFKWLSQMPSDKLMRHPTFRTLYKDSIRKQYDNLARIMPERDMHGLDLKAMEHAARETALKGVNDLLYNVSTKSNAAHFFRFVTSFFSAWEDSITRWAQLAMDKPQLLFVGSKIWDAPNGMNLGMTEDETGRPVKRIDVVDSQGRHVPPERASVDDETRIVARLPRWLLDYIPGAEEFDNVAIPKSSLNLILQGSPWWLPGAGPLVQAPISSIAAKAPNVKQIYEWAIPYGQQSVADTLMPGWAKQAIKSGLGVEDPAYALVYTQIAQTEEMRIREGKRTRPPRAQFAKEIENRAQAAFKIRSFTRFFLPFTADLQSPYQYYIDQYRQMAETYGPDADEKFYTKYGDDLYLFATALSKNNAGIQATEKAWKAGHEFSDLIQEHPEYGALVIGSDANSGPFNQYIHSAQFSEPLGPGSTTKYRERRSPLEAIDDNRRQLGWIEFRKYMGLVDTATKSGTYPPDLISKVRGWIVDFIGKDNRNWLDDYNESDRAAMPKRVEFFTALTNDKRIMGNPLRTDIRVLADYLAIRKQFVAALEVRKKAGLPHTLAAGANARLAQEWQRIRENLAESDTRFGDLYWRYLSRDDLQTDENYNV